MLKVSQLDFSKGMHVLPVSTSSTGAMQVPYPKVQLDGEFVNRFILRLQGMPAISVIESSMTECATQEAGEPTHCTILPINSFLLMLKRTVLKSDLLLNERIVKKWKQEGVTHLHIYFFGSISAAA